MWKWRGWHVVLAGCMIITLSGVLLLTPDRAFSEEENRYLASFPKISWNSIRSGEFGKALELYVADQFPLREYWVTMKAWTEMALHKKENNDVYAGKDGFLLQKLPPSTIPLEEQMAYVRQFGERLAVPLYFMLAPNSAEILAEKLPRFAPIPDQRQYLEQAKLLLGEAGRPISIYNTLIQHKDEDIYYRTDHHWTTLGAYYAYRQLMQAMGTIPLELTDFEIKRVSDSFFGTLFSKSNFRHVAPDLIELWIPQNELTHQVTYVDDGRVSNTLYDWDQLDKRDQYALFLGGNHALTIVETAEAPEKTLLVIKDSYAHSLIPFLTPHYQEIHVADLRYLNISVEEYAEQISADEVLILYNIASFQSDENVVKLKW